MDQGPILMSVAFSATWPRANSALRQSCAMSTGMTMYRTTDVISVSQGTVIDDSPSNSATMGAKANTMIVSLSATWLSVNKAWPPVSLLHTNTVAVQGAAANRIRPAM